MSRIYERTVMSVTAFDNRDIISCVSCLMRAYTDDSMIDVATGKRMRVARFICLAKNTNAMMSLDSAASRLRV